MGVTDKRGENLHIIKRIGDDIYSVWRHKIKLEKGTVISVEGRLHAAEKGGKIIYIDRAEKLWDGKGKSEEEITAALDYYTAANPKPIGVGHGRGRRTTRQKIEALCSEFPDKSALEIAKEFYKRYERKVHTNKVKSVLADLK